MMKDGSNKSLEIHSTTQKKQIVRIDKKGDFNINTFDVKCDQSGSYFLMYSDCVDTQLFKYSFEETALVKLTKKVRAFNDIDKILPAKYIKIYQDDYS